jgi:hypothetical protein
VGKQTRAPLSACLTRQLHHRRRRVPVDVRRATLTL